jgi:hypothetical protein
MYQNRDICYPSMLYSKDTDLYLIAYRHRPQSVHDHVYFFNGTFKNDYIYDMQKFACRYESYAFRVLLILAGTDYNPSIFTRTMIMALFHVANYYDKYYSAPALRVSELIEKVNRGTNVREVIEIFLKMLLIVKRVDHCKYLWPRKVERQPTEIDNQIFGLLEWVIGYYDKGTRYSQYNFPVCKLENFDKLTFIRSLFRDMNLRLSLDELAVLNMTVLNLFELV